MRVHLLHPGHIVRFALSLGQVEARVEVDVRHAVLAESAAQENAIGTSS